MMLPLAQMLLRIPSNHHYSTRHPHGFLFLHWPPRTGNSSLVKSAPSFWEFSFYETCGCWTKNNGETPQIIHFNRIFHFFHHPFWGPTPIIGNIPVYFWDGGTLRQLIVYMRWWTMEVKFFRHVYALFLLVRSVQHTQNSPNSPLGFFRSSTQNRLWIQVVILSWESKVPPPRPPPQEIRP